MLSQLKHGDRLVRLRDLSRRNADSPYWPPCSIALRDDWNYFYEGTQSSASSDSGSSDSQYQEGQIVEEPASANDSGSSDSGSDAGGGDSGDAASDSGSSDAGGGDSGGGDSGGDEGGDDAGDTGGDTESWSGDFTIEAEATNSMGTTTDTCRGTVAFDMSFPAYVGTVECEWDGPLSAIGADSGIVDGIVQPGDTEVIGYIELGWMVMEFEGTYDSSEITASFSGEEGGGGESISWTGTYTATPD